MHRGPPIKSTNLQSYQVFTRTSPNLPLTKNENSEASIKAKYAELRENLAGSNGCITSGTRQRDNHTGITPLHSPDSDIRIGSDTNDIATWVGLLNLMLARVGMYSTLLNNNLPHAYQEWTSRSPLCCCHAYHVKLLSLRSSLMHPLLCITRLNGTSQSTAVLTKIIAVTFWTICRTQLIGLGRNRPHPIAWYHYCFHKM